MSEETTKTLTVDDKLDMLLREMAMVKGELTTLTERVTELEKRTNPLPPNYDARFTALEEQLVGYDARFAGLENQGARFDARFAALERQVRENSAILRGLREDLERERQSRFRIEDRLTAVEDKAA